MDLLARGSNPSVCINLVPFCSERRCMPYCNNQSWSWSYPDAQHCSNRMTGTFKQTAMFRDLATTATAAYRRMKAHHGGCYLHSSAHAAAAHIIHHLGFSPASGQILLLLLAFAERNALYSLHLLAPMHLAVAASFLRRTCTVQALPDAHAGDRAVWYWMGA